MEAIKIDKRVPIPHKVAGGGRKPRYPWNYMEVGDSFLFPKDVKRSTAQSLTYKNKANGKQFAIRTMSEGIRCWRLA